MELKTIEHKAHKARVVLQGSSGSGKTFSALMLAYGLCKDWTKIAVLDTDHACGLYSYLGPFHYLNLEPPFLSEKFLDAVEHCGREGMEVVLLDSLSPEWMGEGGVREQLKTEGKKALDMHFSFLRAIERSPCHIIATLRTKEDYSVLKKNGREMLIKTGTYPLQQSGIHNHFHTVLSLDYRNHIQALKDRTSFFIDHQDCKLSEEIAALFASWCREVNRG